VRYKILFPVTPKFLPPWLFMADDLDRVTYALVGEGDVSLEDPDEALEKLFYVYNSEKRPHPVRSMSVGDVVVLDDMTAWLCLFTGWSPVIVNHAGDGFRVELLAAEVA